MLFALFFMLSIALARWSLIPVRMFYQEDQKITSANKDVKKENLFGFFVGM
jgi:hypothetical protein